MARRNNDRDTSRSAKGGLRKTEATRHIPESARRDVRRDESSNLNEPFFSPDLSAFEFTPVQNRQPVNEAVRSDTVRPVEFRSLPGKVLADRIKQVSRLDPRADQRALARRSAIFDDEPYKRGSSLGDSPRKKEPTRSLIVKANPRRGSVFTLSAVDRTINRPERTVKKAASEGLASRDVSHVVRPKAREVTAQTNCKERPQNQKPRGKGGSKKINYIPWCEVTRKKH